MSHTTMVDTFKPLPLYVTEAKFIQRGERVLNSQYSAHMCMTYLRQKGIQYTYWHKSVCEHVVIIL